MRKTTDVILEGVLGDVVKFLILDELSTPKARYRNPFYSVSPCLGDWENVRGKGRRSATHLSDRAQLLPLLLYRRFCGVRFLVCPIAAYLWRGQVQPLLCHS